jgi:large subunit ribosomal protein L10
MKTREQKQKDLNALTEQLNNSKSAMVVSFNKVTVNKDQEFRHQLREAGANYQVVKNTIARLAVKGTPYENATEHFKGVTAIAWTESDPVILSKAVSKFIKANADLYTFKAGVVDGRLVDLKQVQEIAALPSKEELISKLLFVINAQAQRIVTVINAVPRNLAIVIKQIGEGKTDVPAEQKVDSKEAEMKTEETPVAETEPISEPGAETEIKPEVAEATEQSVEEETSEAAPEAEKEEKSE